MGTSTAQWFVENYIIYVKHVGKVTGDDFRNVDAQIRALMDSASGDHKVHVIVDLYSMDGLPPLREIEGGRVLKHLWEARTGWTVVVDPKMSFMVKIVAGVMGGVAHVPHTIVKNLDEAVKFLKKTAPELLEIPIPDIEDWATDQTPVYEMV